MKTLSSFILICLTIGCQHHNQILAPEEPPVTLCLQGKVAFTDCGQTTFISVTSTGGDIKNKFEYKPYTGQPNSGSWQAYENVVATNFLPAALRKYSNNTFYFTYRAPIKGDSSSLVPCTANFVDVIRDYGDLKYIAITGFSSNRCP